MDKRIETQETVKNLKPAMVNGVYRHFKGNLYVVDNIAVHSESAEPMVIYHSKSNPELVWCRPLSMFSSEVDHDKYPEVEQRWRFQYMYREDSEG